MFSLLPRLYLDDDCSGPESTQAEIYFELRGTRHGGFDISGIAPNTQSR
jgi:hypothetical protein